MSNKNDGTVIQQHFLPEKSYLKYFADGKGQVNAYRFENGKTDFYRTAKHFVANPTKLAKEGYIYESPELPRNALEKTLQNIEDTYREVLEGKILDQKPLNSDDEAKIALFVEALSARVPAQRAHLNSFLDRLDTMGKKMAYVHNSPDAATRFSAEIAETKESFFADSLVQRLLINPMQHSDVCILTISPIFSGSFFVVSDNPVSVVDFAEANTIYGLQPMSKTIEFVVPITPTMAVLVNNAGIDGYKQIDGFFVDEINFRSVFRFAQDFILSPKPLDEAFYDRLPRHFPQSLILKLIRMPRGKADRKIEKIKKAEKRQKPRTGN